MARLNKDAQQILCNMVAEKASEKRSALVAELNGLDASLDSDYKKRLAAASVKLDEAIRYARCKIDTILAQHGLQWGKSMYADKPYSFDRIIDDGELKSDLTDYIKPVKEASKRRECLKQDIEDLDAKVAKAKQEILLRAALGMKYDEVVGIINDFEF